MALTNEEVASIRRQVYDQLIYALKMDLRGDEQIFKEVWESCPTEAELRVAKKEIKTIISHLEKMNGEIK